MNQILSKTDHCRVAVFDAANQPLRLENVELPQPVPGELLIKIDACTICGSDLHTVIGARSEKTPSILGHEIVGTIAIMGDQEIRDANQLPLNVGDRVTWSVCLSCLRCERCRSGIPQKCEQLKKIGHEKLDTGLLGGFSEYVVLPASSTVFKIETPIEDDVICPVNCATATVLAAFRTVNSINNKSFLLIGSGLLGLTASAYADSNGADKIYMIEPDTRRQKIAAEFGAWKVFSSSDEIEDGQKFDVIMDFSGVTSAFESTFKLANLGGQIVLVGSVMPGPPCKIDPEFFVRNLIRLDGVHNYIPDDLRKAVCFLEEHGSDYPFQGLVEKSFPLEKINEAIEYAIEHKPIRVMIRP